MADNDWAPTKDDDAGYEQMNELVALLQEISRDQIAQLIEQNLRGIDLQNLLKPLWKQKAILPTWAHQMNLDQI